MAYGVRTIGSRSYGDGSLGGTTGVPDSAAIVLQNLTANAIGYVMSATLARVSHEFTETVWRFRPAARVNHEFAEAVVHVDSPVKVYHVFTETIIRNYPVVMGLG